VLELLKLDLRSEVRESRVHALNYSYSLSEHKQTTRLLSVEYIVPLSGSFTHPVLRFY
jgi:hypothetical protein